MGHLKVAAVPLGLAAVVLLLALGTTPAAAGQYIVRPGDTLWSISQSHHLDLHRLVAMNDFGDPNLIHPGDRVTVPDPPPPPAATIAAPRAAAPAGLHGAAAKAIIVAAARRHGLNPNFALAVSFWESGWNQSAVSSTGAVGLMQIEPYTGAWAGPAFLGRRVDLNNATDNAELGSALLRQARPGRLLPGRDGDAEARHLPVEPALRGRDLGAPEPLPAAGGVTDRAEPTV
ncbi:MAG: LysM peptidoglycan-binding domain-containing protein [Chloroflexi bacterium]|nr:MAG: LysM peptidoglycan-binding domain-containing protein [Chloroflexota bacterium]